jgi:ligand-binding sensor protein
MVTAEQARPASDAELQLFREHLEQDFQFFQIFFVLFNRSGPIRNVDLVWTERGPAGRVGLRSLTVKDALRSDCPQSLAGGREDPAPALCLIINDHGRHEAETCALSDGAAAERVGRTGRSEVYPCHFRIVDIAVPVVADGMHIATLFSGQVLLEAPSEDGFQRILRSVERLDYIDRAALEKAYWNMPVVSREDVRSAVEVLETFALYLGNTCSRIAVLAREQQRRVREQQLLSKELAYLALDGNPSEHPALRDLLRRLGFARPPNRVLAVEVEPASEPGSAGLMADLGVMAAAQAIEGVCAKTERAVSVHLHHRGICVLIDDGSGRNPAEGEFHARRVARQLLQVTGEHTG